jgi:hypothetical protein
MEARRRSGSIFKHPLPETAKLKNRPRLAADPNRVLNVFGPQDILAPLGSGYVLEQRRAMVAMMPTRLASEPPGSRSAAFVVVKLKRPREPNVVHALDWNLTPLATFSLVVKETSYITYKKLLEIARLCADQARASTSKAVAQELWRMAREYQERAAKIDGKLPYIEAPPMHGPE